MDTRGETEIIETRTEDKTRTEDNTRTEVNIRTEVKTKVKVKFSSITTNRHITQLIVHQTTAVHQTQTITTSNNKSLLEIGHWEQECNKS